MSRTGYFRDQQKRLARPGRADAGNHPHTEGRSAMTDPFITVSPATAGDYADQDNFKSSEHEGELLLIRVTDYKAEFVTSAGTTDAISAEVTVVDGPKAGTVYPDALLFGKVMVPELRPHVGKLVLGRLGKGNAKAGKSAPWVLNPANEADMATGRNFIAGTVATPAATAAPPF